MYHAENSGVAEGEIEGLAKDGYNRAQFKENYMTEICSDSRRMDVCIKSSTRPGYDLNHAEHVLVAEGEVEGLDEDGRGRVVARELAQRQHQPAMRECQTHSVASAAACTTRQFVSALWQT